MNVEGTYIDGSMWALYCGNCGKPTPEWSSPDRLRDGGTITCHNCDATDVRDMSVEELIEVYDELRSEADHLPSDDPRCVETELLWSVVHQVFGDGRVQ